MRPTSGTGSATVAGNRSIVFTFSQTAPFTCPAAGWSDPSTGKYGWLSAPTPVGCGAIAGSDQWAKTFVNAATGAVTLSIYEPSYGYPGGCSSATTPVLLTVELAAATSGTNGCRTASAAEYGTGDVWYFMAYTMPAPSASVASSAVALAGPVAGVLLGTSCASLLTSIVKLVPTTQKGCPLDQSSGSFAVCGAAGTQFMILSCRSNGVDANARYVPVSPVMCTSFEDGFGGKTFTLGAGAYECPPGVGQGAFVSTRY